MEAEIMWQRAQDQHFRQLEVQLHQALSREDWAKVLVTAEAMLELSPEHGVSRKAWRRAWQEAVVKTTQSYHSRNAPNRPGRRWEWGPYRRGSQVALAWQKPAAARESVVMENVRTKLQPPGRRLVAWIDAVGGYLLCLDEEVSLGQTSPRGAADVSIQADLSRRHAVIRRTGESYVLTPIHSAQVDGVPRTGPAILKDGALLQLGDSVRLRFRHPHALSATALLIPESHHRIDPAVDAIVLMSDSCILGPRQHSHICCRHWPDDLVLVRQGEQLRAHTQMPLQVDGQPYDRQACLIGIGRLENDSIGLSIEKVEE